MKKIVIYIKEFLSEEFNISYFVFIALFLSGLITVNYLYDFEDNFRRAYLGSAIYYFYTFLYYAFPYIIAIVAYIICYKKYHLFTNKSLWFSVLFLLVSLSINEGFNFHREYLRLHFPDPIYYYVKICVVNFASFFLYTFPLLVYWWLYDKKQQPFYGLNAKFDAKPYFIMILLMVPLITWASFQADFLQAYPIYNGKGIVYLLQLKNWQGLLIFETCYSLDFVAIEIAFRGFMILAIGKYLGKGAILPMVTLYCVFHFGKPLGETISSIFGGLILGILAYNTRSIYGGVIIHLGVALMMEAGAMLQKGI